MKNLSILLVVLLVVASCGKPSLVGSWIQPIPGMENQMQGIKLEKDGKASSINMHTLVYKSWKREGNQLILTGESIGNGQTIQFSDDFEIVTLTEDVLILKVDDIELSYRRATK